MSISIIDAPEAGIDVDLWGHSFLTRPLTRSIEQAKAKFSQTVDTFDNEDDVIDCIANMVGVLLEPAPAEKKKPVAKRATPAELIVEKWKADEVSSTQLMKLLEDLFDAGENDRPT